MIERKCACGAVFLAKEADVRRGWAKSCSKSCAATRREKKTGNYQRHLMRLAEAEAQEDYPMFDNAHQFDNTEPVQDNPR